MRAFENTEGISKPIKIVGFSDTNKYEHSSTMHRNGEKIVVQTDNWYKRRSLPDLAAVEFTKEEFEVVFNGIKSHCEFLDENDWQMKNMRIHPDFGEFHVVIKYKNVGDPFQQGISISVFKNGQEDIEIFECIISKKEIEEFLEWGADTIKRIEEEFPWTVKRSIMP